MSKGLAKGWEWSVQSKKSSRNVLRDELVVSGATSALVVAVVVVVAAAAAVVVAVVAVDVEIEVDSDADRRDETPSRGVNDSRASSLTTLSLPAVVKGLALHGRVVGRLTEVET
ncbi:hypothetical protein HDZ31DRAFT_67644 [Schizophyllum fasciatum]